MENQQGTAGPPHATEPPEGSLEAQIVEALRGVFDPEIPTNIYELGLIYNIDIGDTGEVKVEMTLTSPMCPVAGSLPGEVEIAVANVKGVSSAEVDVVWDPTWNPSMMSEVARLETGMM